MASTLYNTYHVSFSDQNFWVAETVSVTMQYSTQTEGYVVRGSCQFLCVKLLLLNPSKALKKALFTRKLDLNFRNKLVKCYIWSTALCGVETGRLGK
jgi:hypothetical protein